MYLTLFPLSTRSYLSMYTENFKIQSLAFSSDPKERVLFKIIRTCVTHSIYRLIKVIPLSMMAVTAKILTYWSYKRVPVSITHTAKVRTR